MRRISSLTLAVMMSLLMVTVAAFARDKNRHNVEIPETVKVGAGELAPGEYTMEWNESGPTAEVSFFQNGKSVLQTPARVVSLPHAAQTDSLTMGAETGNTRTLEEVEFGGHKEAFSFSDKTGE